MNYSFNALAPAIPGSRCVCSEHETVKKQHRTRRKLHLKKCKEACASYEPLNKRHFEGCN